MQHHFDIDIASEYGVDVAIIVNNLDFWLSKNAANETNIIDGKVWTYNSATSFAKLFPYWTSNQIRRIIKKMEDADIIETGVFNKVAYDRTRWFTFSDAFVKKHISILRFVKIDFNGHANRLNETEKPIPDINTDINTDSKPDDVGEAVEKDSDTENTIDTVLDYLNSRTGKTYRKQTEAHRKYIRARLGEGYELQDFKDVIDSKIVEWDDEKMAQFIRPRTLFAPSHFDDYLQAAVKPKEPTPVVEIDAEEAEYRRQMRERMYGA